MTHDIIGKRLTSIWRDTDENGMIMDLPKVFIAIQNYFIENPEQLANSHLFEKLDIEQMKKVDEIEQHVAFGDYSFLMTIHDSSIIGCFLQCVLKYMQEPLCTFEKYDMYKVICEELPAASSSRPPSYESILKCLVEMLLSYDQVHRQTWRFLLHFLESIAHCNPKLTARNIATIFSDVLFRPAQYRATDQSLWRLFIDLLVLMIEHNKWLFSEVDKERQIEEEAEFQRQVQIAAYQLEE